MATQRNLHSSGELQMTEHLTNYDPAAALVDDAEIAFFMSDALATGDASYIAKALGVVARAKGMADIADKTGLSREQLYRSFSENGNPTLKSTLAVMKALGIDLAAKAHEGGVNLSILPCRDDGHIFSLTEATK
jgi:probable addiction module antidote protein